MSGLEFRAWTRFLNLIKEHGIPRSLRLFLRKHDEELLHYLHCVQYPERCGESVHEFGCVKVADPGDPWDRAIEWLCGILTPWPECIAEAIKEYYSRYGVPPRKFIVEWIPQCEDKLGAGR